MTVTDWIGAILVVVLAILMFIAYFYAFRPANKNKFKSYENLVNKEEN